MNHRDRDAHNNGFKMGTMSKGITPKETIDGGKVVANIIALLLIAGVIIRLI